MYIARARAKLLQWPIGSDSNKQLDYMASETAATCFTPVEGLKNALLECSYTGSTKLGSADSGDN